MIVLSSLYNICKNIRVFYGLIKAKERAQQQMPQKVVEICQKTCVKWHGKSNENPVQSFFKK